ncbi:hypothetical protein B0H66DRAFT_597101 [Apodospora peruviana]|uniref:Deubiquitination-protection protein dph1 n=1 Tax=Apodospora peruviana TaxID=516989 RepID=A0AAE0MEJ0_9PEZI|nr:hypothetical protein B0H66DRAFT_597101 [Apodospora peruviana]
MADSSEPASEAQITFKVKSSSDKTHTITMSESATVSELKTKLATSEYEDVPADRQRLIYSGRVMKNDDALSVYKIKHLNTIHMVKSAASNPAPAPTTSAASAPTPQAVPQNMAAGASANNLLAGLTGARFAGHANLPSRDLFGADGGMGAPPTEEQMAEMLSSPAVAQTMNEALNNPTFIDYMIQSNPMLANMPNAREMLQSPAFRHMMTNPDAIRMASRMRRMMGAPSFPAPGVTDTTPQAEGNTTNPNSAPPFPGFPSFPFGAGAGADPAGNPFAALLQGPNPFGMPPFTAPGTSPSPGQAPPASDNRSTPQAGATPPTSSQTASTATPGQPATQNPFAALFGAAPGQGAAGPNAGPFGLPPISPEAMQQMMQLLGGVGGMEGLGGMGGMGAPTSPPAPADNRPPEERYATQLSQLNDMGFFDFDRNVAALRRSGGNVQGAIEHLLGSS